MKSAKNIMVLAAMTLLWGCAPGQSPKEPKSQESVVNPAAKKDASVKRVNLVAVGEKLFMENGCFECHSTTRQGGENKAGPSLFSLVRKEPRPYSVFDSKTGQVFETVADEDYIKNSLRDAGTQLAIKKSGTPYDALMPDFPEDILSDFDIQALTAWMKRLNDRGDQGAGLVWADLPDESYNYAADPYAVWVKDTPRLQRVDVGPRHSARTYHVGLPGGINYNFDPRLMAIVDIWSGPFLTVENEQRGRANNPSVYAEGAKIWPAATYWFPPLDSDGKAIDLGFKEPAGVNEAQGLALVADKSNYLETVSGMKAHFLGVETPKSGIPTFRYSIENNQIDMAFEPKVDGSISARFSMNLLQPQSFHVPTGQLKDIHVSAGKIDGKIWTVPAGNYSQVTLEAKARQVPDSGDVVSEIPDEDRSPQSLVWTPPHQAADLLQGYSTDSAASPKDMFGRDQLFEPMGITFQDETTAYISTRTAGIWKVVDGEWHQFAEGTFESLGVVVESASSIMIGEKPALTRLVDLDGDHWAESRENISDQFRFTGNYHAYLHGPVKFEKGYLYTLNLEHNLPGNYKAGGKYMGTSGGYRGWMIKIGADGSFTPYANGMRSPASLGISPSGDIVYADNQGEYVGTSKLYFVERGAFYGHPSGLIDIPGLNSESPEVQWDAVKGKRALPAILLPHGQTHNSPGNPVWDETGGKFGPFTGQMFVGDQTLSTIYRIAIEEVDGVKQGALLPFADGLQSGVMRMAFNPADNSMWVGQTGRGWRAKGGAIDSLQRINWDGTEIDAIQNVKVTKSGFKIIFTSPQNMNSFGDVKIRSWHYRDAPDYGSAELDDREEKLYAATWSEDAIELRLDLKDFSAPPPENENTARVYHFDLTKTSFGKTHTPYHSKAWYTLNKVPADN